jgi:hypothetical protein
MGLKQRIMAILEKRCSILFLLLLLVTTDAVPAADDTTLEIMASRVPWATGEFTGNSFICCWI